MGTWQTGNSIAVEIGRSGAYAARQRVMAWSQSDFIDSMYFVDDDNDGAVVVDATVGTCQLCSFPLYMVPEATLYAQAKTQSIDSFEKKVPCAGIRDLCYHMEIKSHC